MKEIEVNGRVIDKGEGKVRIRVLGEGQVVAWEEVLFEVRLGQDLWVRQFFVVLEEGALPYCFLLGNDFLKAYKFKIDLERDRMYQDLEGGVELDLRAECVVNFVGLLSLSMENESEILNDDEIWDMQEESLEVSELKKCIIERIHVCEWPASLRGMLRSLL